jgi:hypothetical protein
MAITIIPPACVGHHKKAFFLKRAINSGGGSAAFGVLLALRGAGVMAVTAIGPQITKAVCGRPF